MLGSISLLVAGLILCQVGLVFAVADRLDGNRESRETQADRPSTSAA